MPSFRIDEMTLLELRHATTSATRMLSLLTAGYEGEETKLRPRHILDIPQIQLTSSFRDIFIVPGGLYLVALTDANVQIWDLEQSYHKACRLYLPISLSAPRDIKFQLLIGVCASHSSGDYSAFRIAASSRELPGRITHLVIYEYDAARSPFQITPIAEKVTTLFFGRHSTILGDILAFSEHQGDLTLWNFVNDTYSKLDIGWQWRYTNILIDENYVFLRGLDRVDAYRKPHFSPLRPNEHLEIEAEQTTLSPHCAFDLVTAQDSDHLISLDSWYFDVPDMYTFDVVQRYMSSIVTCVNFTARFRIDPTTLDGGPRHRLAPWPCCIASTQELDKCEHPVQTFWSSHRLCDGLTVACYLATSIVAFVVPEGENASGHNPPLTLNPKSFANPAKVELMHSEQTILQYSFNPVSGRLAYCRHDGLKVVDYLWHSMEKE
ncbi:unnamed protein product [Cyclocybe aegerita]|uniref:Uncharacterized protein n=1 Tax=Cyclocybe aegerita TaxID=1973307 RepID=A0A8S0XNL1_CYCAE|nr:unnamed protein product [Cyclocybe aegerita]